MKKYLLLATITLGFSVSLFAEKLPRIELHQQGGEFVEHGVLDHPYIGYGSVSSKHTGFWFWEKVVVRCTGKGVLVCKAVVDGTAIIFPVQGQDEKETYDFEANVILDAANQLLEEVAKLQYKENDGKGEKSKIISAFDKSGQQRLVAFRCVYDIDKSLSGTTQVYIEVIK